MKVAARILICKSKKYEEQSKFIICSAQTGEALVENKHSFSGGYEKQFPLILVLFLMGTYFDMLICKIYNLYYILCTENLCINSFIST
jgi:hypothetical protein